MKKLKIASLTTLFFISNFSFGASSDSEEDLFSKNKNKLLLAFSNKKQTQKKIRKKNRLVLDRDVHDSVIMQNKEEGTGAACGLLSVMIAAKACGVEEVPTVKSLADLFPKRVIVMTNKKGIVTYNTRKFGNKHWVKALESCGLETYEVLKSQSFHQVISEAMRAIEKKGTALLLHGPNHYSVVGGYRINRAGEIEFQMCFYNQRPDTWLTAQEFYEVMAPWGRRLQICSLPSTSPTEELPSLESL